MRTSPQQLGRNIPLSHAIAALSWGRFFIPVLALFYIASQVTFSQFSIIMAVFAAVTLVLEIPSGAFADRIGRRNALLLSKCCYVIEVSVLAFADGFWPFLIAKVISGIGVSLSSGTAESLLYDTLRAQRRQREYGRVLGTMRSISRLAMAIVFITGGILFSIDAKFAATASLPLQCGALLLTFFLVEPPASKHPPSNILASLRRFFTDRALRRMFLVALSATAIISVTLSSSSAYLSSIGTPTAFIGAVAFFSAALTALAAARAHVVVRQYGIEGTALLVQTTLIVGTLLMASLMNLWGILPFILVAMMDGIFGVLASDTVNGRVTRDRTTMLSIQNLADNVGVAIIFPVMGMLSMSYGIAAGFAALGGVGILGMIIAGVTRA